MAGGDTKSEKATPKKRRDERKKGNIFQSKDIITVVSLLGVTYTIKLLFPRIYLTAKEFLVRYITYAGTKEKITSDFVIDITTGFIVAFASIIVPILLMSILTSIVATAAQTKLLFSMESLKPKWSRISLLQGFKRLFSLKSLVEVVKGTIKITILFVILFNYFESRILDFSKTISMSIMAATGFILSSCVGLIFNISIAFVAISVLDYFYQWWDYERQLKMSKQDIKEEYKQTEGNPQIKGKIKELQRKMAMSRMMQEVPGADVVIKNPTHFAVALRYNSDRDAAPVLVAKGQDEMALRIIKVAEMNGVYVVENKPLARAIYATTDLKREIPAEFYGTIAEILVTVYKLKNKKLL